MPTIPALDFNLSRYPKLRLLLETDIAEGSKFLTEIKNLMERKGLSHNQAFTACKIMDEKINKCLKPTIK